MRSKFQAGSGVTEVEKLGDIRGVNQNELFMKKTRRNVRFCKQSDKYKGLEQWSNERMGGYWELKA